MLHTFVALVQDKPGVLTRVASLFRRLNINIVSLTVGESERPDTSRMTIVCEADSDAHAAHRIRAFLDKRSIHPRAISLLLALTPTLATAQAPKPAPPHQTPHITIRILNARTNKPILDERLNISLRADQPGGGTLPTDKHGLILVDIGDASTIRILSNMYADCRSRAELYTNYPISTIRSTGITTGNLCSHISPPPKPGELLLFEIPRTYIPTYPHSPASSLPHSDENPNVPGPPPTH